MASRVEPTKQNSTANNRRETPEQASEAISTEKRLCVCFDSGGKFTGHSSLQSAALRLLESDFKHQLR